MYEPVVDDYVKWKDIEGWVYYKGDEYITIEVGVKDKPKCEYTQNEKHKKIHTLVVCQTWFWDELEYVKNRRSSHYSDAIATYKSQTGRYLDIQ